MSNIFSSESVTEGHPDKIADQISDAVLDAILEEDKNARVACETLLTTGLVVIAGEVTTQAQVNYADIARKTICEIGYDSQEKGFDGNTCGVVVAMDRQSPDIAQGVDRALEFRNSNDAEVHLGAGDQGMMVGFACDETPDFMPFSIWLAHKLSSRLAEVRHGRLIDYLRPDGKTQVSIVYDNYKPVALSTVVISTQTAPSIEHGQIEEDLRNHVLKASLPPDLDCSKFEFYVNPTGSFVLGGPQADTGLTGRKIIVDTYGGYARHGGGAFSGKDPTKVDRSGAYMARWVAKHIVASGAADRCEIQVAYAIGKEDPVSIFLETYNTHKVDKAKISKAVSEVFDFRPAQIIKQLDLLRPIYKKTAAYGHFGKNDPDLTWETLSKLSEFKSALGI